MTALQQEPTVYTVEETARLLRCGRSSTYAAIRAGQIPSIKIGRRILIPRHGLEALLSGPINSDGPAGHRAEAKTRGDGSHGSDYT